MENNKYKSKRFLLPILSLVLTTIISIAIISSIITINVFENHMHEHIEQIKKEYTEKQKNKVYKDVKFVSDSIKFQITKIEDLLKDSLKEKIKIALQVSTHIYNNHKDTHNKEELKEMIASALSEIKFYDWSGNINSYTEF